MPIQDSIIIGYTVTGATNAVAAINKFNLSAKASTAIIAKFSTILKATAPSIATFSASITRGVAQLGALLAPLNAVTLALASFNTALRVKGVNRGLVSPATVSRITKLNLSLRSVVKSTAIFKRSIDVMIGALTRFNVSLATTNKSLISFNTALRASAGATVASATASKTAAVSTGRITKATVGATAATGGFSKATRGLNTSLYATNRAVNTALVGFKSLLLVIGAFLAIKGAITQFQSFEFEMAKVQAVTSATGEEFKTLNDLTRSLGATTVFTAQEASQALLFLGQAGLKTAELLQALPDTLTLAQAGFLELPRAADIVVSTLRGFGLEAKQTGEITDIMAQTASNSKTTIEGLGQSFSYVAPLARTLGVSLADTSAILGILANRGLNAGRAGRGLTQFFVQLSKITPDAQKALKNYGLTLDDVNVKTKGAREVIQTLAKANITVADTYRIFGRIGGLVALSLRDSTKELEELAKKTNNAAGAASIMSRIMNDTQRGSLKQFTSAVSELFITLGKKLAPALIGIVKIMTGVLSAFNGMYGTFLKNNIVSQMMHNIITRVVIGWKVFTTVLKAIVSVLFNVGKIIFKIAGDFAKLGIAIFDAGTEATGLSESLSNLKFDSKNQLRNSIVKTGAVLIVLTNSIGGAIKNILGVLLYGYEKTFGSIRKAYYDFQKTLNPIARVRGFYAKLAKEEIGIIDEFEKRYEKAKAGLSEFSFISADEVQKQINELQNSFKNKTIVFKQEFVVTGKPNTKETVAEVFKLQGAFKDLAKYAKEPGEALADSLSEAVAQGKLNFAELINSFLKDLAAALLKAQIFKPLIDQLTGQTGDKNSLPGLLQRGFEVIGNALGSPSVVGAGAGTGSGLKVSGLDKFNPPPQLPPSDLASVASVESRFQSKPSITIVDQRTNAPEIQQKTNGNGDIELLVTDSVKKEINNAGFDRVLSSNFNIRRKGEF